MALKLCRIVTVPETFQTLLREQVRCIVSHGIHVTLVSAPGKTLTSVAAEVGAESVGIPMLRQPAVAADVQSLIRMTAMLRQRHYDIVHSSTPKAGLLAALASMMARAPIRIHTFTGQPWVELTGFRRRIPREADRLVGRLSTQCYADSLSQREFLIREGVVAARKIGVIGAGSISGVDLARFSLARWGGAAAALTRRELRIPNESPVVVFVGRLTRDKGIVELARAFEALEHVDVHLVLVGPLEPDRDPLPAETLARLTSHPRVRVMGFSATPEKYLAAADVFCLPSYREGFGSVVIEAAAMELPSVVTNVTGLADAIVDGSTGLVVPAKNAGALATALARLISSKDLRRTLGCAARERVEEQFSSDRINEGVVAEYLRLAAR